MTLLALSRHLQWSGDGLFDRPAEVYPASEHIGLDPKMNSPLLHVHGIALPREQPTPSRWPSVEVLNRTCGPSTVFWAVWAVVVDAVKRVTHRRPRPHVGEERLKTVPSLARGDSAPAVVGEGSISRVHTSVPHLEPDSMLRRPRLAVPTLRVMPWSEVVCVNEPIPGLSRLSASTSTSLLTIHGNKTNTGGAP